MYKYIKQEDAIKALGERPMNWMDTPEELQAISDYEFYMNAILTIPAADVVEVRHGRWIVPERIMYRYPQYVCSECQKDEYWKGKFSHGNEYYCPNCGAKMDKEYEKGEEDA